MRFLDPGELVDNDLTLKLRRTTPADPVTGFVPTYHFDMRHTHTGALLGGVSLRVGNSESVVMYAGHIGYGVVEPYRGQHLAARSCRLLYPLARAHGLSPLWITCDPDNAASRKTCELAGGILVEIVAVPQREPMYAQGHRNKCRYRVIP